jgi:hypothetical protein
MENMNTLIGEIAKCLGEPEDFVRNFFGDIATLRRLKVGVLKKTLCYLKSRLGLRFIDYKKNKDDCVTQLTTILSGFKTNGVQFPAPQKHQLPQPLVPAAQTLQQSQRPQAVPAHVPPRAAVPMTPVDAQVINTPRKVELYKSLISAGLTPQTASRGIRDASAEELKDLDLLLMSIIMKVSKEEDGDDDDEGDDVDDDDSDGSRDEDSDDENNDADSEEDIQGMAESDDGDTAAKQQKRAIKEKKRLKLEKMRKRRLEDIELKKREDDDMDAAILNSEGERIFIADRAKQRINDLRSDCNCTLGIAPEFAMSLLTGAVGIPSKQGDGRPHNTLEDEVIRKLMISLKMEGCNSNCKLIVALIEMLDARCCTNELPTKRQRRDDNGQPSEALLCLVDSPTDSSSSSNGSSSSSSSSSNSSSSSSSSSTSVVETSTERNGGDFGSEYPRCYCSKTRMRLQSSISRLLILEKQAVKYYKNKAYAYLVSLSQKLDKELHLLDVTEAATEQPKGTEEPAIERCAAPARISDTSQFISICALLEEECVRIETAIYSIPTDNDSVPKMFRDAFPPEWNPTAYCLEDDGLELL